MEYHVPVLLSESIEALKIKPNGVYVDATFGGGGHSRAILEKLGPEGILIGFDQDADAIANAPDDERFVFVHNNFRFIRNYLRYHGIEEVDGILADLGVSSHHFDTPERGFSFRFDEALDMRMDQERSLTAAGVLATYEADDLQRIFAQWGELPNVRRFVQAIIERRQPQPITTIGELKAIVTHCYGQRQGDKLLAQVFQALRIEVNNEMDVLKQLLEASLGVLCKRGRLVVITYHSIEDRLVKQFMRAGNIEGTVEEDLIYGGTKSPFKLLTNKAIVANDQELERNPRSRSAQLRIAEKL